MENNKTNSINTLLYKRNMLVFRIAKVLQSLIFVIPIWVAFERQYLSYAQFTMIEALLVATQILFDLPTGVIADIVGRRITISLGLLLWSIAMVLYSFSSTFPQFILYAVVYGMGNSFTSGSWEALLYDTVKSAGREREFTIESARQNMIFQFGFACACMIGGWIGNISYIYAIWATGCIWFIGSVVALFFIEPAIDSMKYSFSEYKQRLNIGIHEIIKTKHVASISLFYILVGSLTWTTQVVFNATLFTQLGFTPVEFGYVYGLLRLLSGVSVFLFAKKLHLINKSSVFLFFAMILVIGFLPGVFFTKWSAIPFVLLLMVGSTSRWSILGRFTNAEYSSENRATALSALSTCINCIYVVVMLTSGILMERFGGVKVVYSLLGLIALVTVVPLGIHLAHVHKGHEA